MVLGYIFFIIANSTKVWYNISVGELHMLNIFKNTSGNSQNGQNRNSLQISKQYATEFEDKCARNNAHGFLRFVTEPDYNNISLLDLMAQTENVLRFQKTQPPKQLALNEQDIKAHMNSFFSQYMPKKVEEVRQILDRTNPYFIDRDGGCHINFIPVSAGDAHTSSVGHFGTRSFLEFNVYLHSSIDDLTLTAHELSHAVSSHHKHLIDLIRGGAQYSEIEKYTKKNFDRDCSCEIESHITEKLFNKYLVEKGLYSKEDLDNYEALQQCSLISEINLIREESDILKQLPCPVTQESLSTLVENLQNNHNDRLIKRIEKMHDNNRSSSYMFRYVVGRIVADRWIKNFDKCENQEKQKEMLDNFQDYLDNTHSSNLDNACENLLGQNFNCTVEDYVVDKINNKKLDNSRSR